jgi:superfamily I DNA/RNA helicase
MWGVKKRTISEGGKMSDCFSFKSLGIQAQGRTTILRINYRNTRQILMASTRMAGSFQLGPTPSDDIDIDDDGVPLITPMTCGREGEEAIIVAAPSLSSQLQQVARLVSNAHHRDGYDWSDMAILCRFNKQIDACCRVLNELSIPFQKRQGRQRMDPGANLVKVLSIHGSKGLEFPVVAIVGVPWKGSDEESEARLFYVGATRATDRLIVVADDKTY